MFIHQCVLLLFFLQNGLSFFTNQGQIPIDYCMFDCVEGVHTVCSRKNNCLAVGGCLQVPPNFEFRQQILKLHNEFRNSIAEGRIKGYYNNSGATDMQVMSYDLELEYFAECWVNLCPGLKAETCKDSLRFPVGQNAYSTSSDLVTSSIDIAKEAFADWSKTLQNVFNPSLIASYHANPASSFTQLVWSRTRFVGCAMGRYGLNYRQALLFCNYGPTGNVEGEPVYKMVTSENYVDEDCEYKNKIYSSLCGTIGEIPTVISWSLEIAQSGVHYPLKKTAVAAGGGKRCAQFSLLTLSFLMCSALWV